MSLDIQYISLDVSKKPTSQQLRLGQGDSNATQVVVSIFDEGVVYDLTGYDVRLSIRLPKNGGYYQVDGTSSGNVATFDVDELYAASVAGVDGFGYVDILDGDSIVCSTSRFQLVVLQCVTEGVEVAPQYVDAINDAINRTLAAAEAAEGVVLQDVPLMSETLRGGAQVGDGLDVEDGALYVDATGIANGALHVAHGGTGSTSASDARTALGVYSTGDVDTALAGKAAASHTHAAADVTSGQLAIERGGTGASTAAGAKAAIVDGQALAPASVAATGAVSGSSISDGTGTLAQLRESVSQKVGTYGLSSGQLRRYTNAGNDYVQIYWTVSSTLNYLLQFNCTAGTGGLYKTENGTTTQIKSL